MEDFKMDNSIYQKICAEIGIYEYLLMIQNTPEAMKEIEEWLIDV
jgi:hypothetical protein